MSKRKTIALKTGDCDQAFMVDEAVASVSPILSLFFMDENYSNDPIIFSRISYRALPFVISYCCCINHFDQVMAQNTLHRFLTKQDVSKFEYKFINTVAKEKDMLFQLTKAANYLSIEGLLNLCCKTLANFIPGKTPNQIRTIFTVKNRHYKDEDEMIRKELGWPAD